MTKEELGRLYPVMIKPYNPDWKALFEAEQEFLRTLFPDDLSIVHIGSTAVAGLPAKPTIDILMEKPASVSESAIFETFVNSGYIHMREQTNHLMFVKGYTPTGLEEISYHVHMGPRDQSWLWDRVYFCEYLQRHSVYKNEYRELKLQLAERYRNDREAYTEAKAAFITKVTAEAKAALA